MSNYSVFKARVNNQDQYESLSANIYNKSGYTTEETSYYAKGLSFGFMGRVKVFFAQALANLGLISGVERDARIAAEVSRVGRTLIQQIGKDTGYYAQNTAEKVSLFDDDDQPQVVREVPTLEGRLTLLTDEQAAELTRIDSEDILASTEALKRALSERAYLKAILPDIPSAG